MNSTTLVEGENLVPNVNRTVQVFYYFYTSPANHRSAPATAKYLAIVSTGLGRTNNVTRLAKWASYLSKTQEYAVLLYNYPGLGKSSIHVDGLSQVEQIVLDLKLIIQIAREAEWFTDQIFLIGISVGTGPTIRFLRDSNTKYRGVMLFSPYKKPSDMTGIDRELKEFFDCDKDEIRGFNSFETMREVMNQSITQDITVVVGTDDVIIDPQHGDDIYRMLKNTAHTARLIRINGASHGEVRTVAREHVQPVFENPASVPCEVAQHDLELTAHNRWNRTLFWTAGAIYALTNRFR